jgi:RimJ/RimL family protein N-acetyltransferase
VTVSLRRARSDDVDFLRELVTDENTRAYLSTRAIESEDAVRAEVARSEAEPDAFGWFVVEVDGEPAGSVAFTRTNERSRIVEASRFAIAPPFRGRGVGLEAAR